MADFLPLDLIFDILLQLPVRDLQRYRCVSIAWRSLIDDPDFIKLHLHHSKKTNSNMAAFLFRGNALFRIDLDAPSVTVKLNHPNLIDVCSEVKILGSCNGLLALNSGNDIFLWNPSTRRHKKLPTSNGVDLPSGFVVHYTKNTYGFGHDPVNDDYKFVRITQYNGVDDEDPFHTEVEVYSAKENAWKRKNCVFPYFLQCGNYAALAGNALHWPVSRERIPNVLDSIVAFDLMTEECHEIPQPDYEKTNNSTMELRDLGGSLSVTYCYYLEDMYGGIQLYRVDVWVMKEYGDEESWTKLFSVEPSVAIGNFSYATPIAYPKSGDQVLLNQDHKKFIAYDLITKKANRVRIPNLPQSFGTCLCVGSLIGLDGDWDEVWEIRKKKNHKKQNLNAKQRLIRRNNRGFQY